MSAPDRLGSWWGSCSARLSQFGFLIDVPTMTNLVHNDNLFPVERLINYAVLSLSTLEQAGQITGQRLGLDFSKVFSQPMNSAYDAAGDWGVHAFQLPDGGFEEARSLHTTPALDAVRRFPAAGLFPP
jgi:hypothetical protein